MKAISLWQPWASAICVGIKCNETRGFYVGHRGPLAIHAAKLRENPDQETMWGWKASEKLRAKYGKFDNLPFGAFVATCRLTEVLRSDDIDLTELERAWGDYRRGRYVWVLEDIKALPEPIPWRGQQGLFDIPDDLLKP